MYALQRYIFVELFNAFINGNENFEAYLNFIKKLHFI